MTLNDWLKAEQELKQEFAEQTDNINKQETIMTTANLDLTLDICAEDGSRTRFYQSDEASVRTTLRQLTSSRLFNQPLLTLASEHSVTAIPSRAIDLILAHTESPPPLLSLPPDWLDIVEVNGSAFLEEAGTEELPEAKDKAASLVEIHTVGDWMIRLKLETANRATIHEQRQLLAHFSDLLVIPFRLKAGGIGFINPPKISRVTVCPPFKGVFETALPADLLQCIRS